MKREHLKTANEYLKELEYLESILKDYTHIRNDLGEVPDTFIIRFNNIPDFTIQALHPQKSNTLLVRQEDSIVFFNGIIEKFYTFLHYRIDDLEQKIERM